jgi:hypothetical protein
LLNACADGVHRGCGDRRCGVARRWFEEDVGLLADFVKLFGNQEAVVFVGDGNGFTQPGDPVEAAQRVLQQRKIVDQAEKLLRVMRSRQRPQTGARASTENYRANDRGVHLEPARLLPTAPRPGKVRGSRPAGNPAVRAMGARRNWR